MSITSLAYQNINQFSFKSVHKSLSCYCNKYTNTQMHASENKRILSFVSRDKIYLNQLETVSKSGTLVLPFITMVRLQLFLIVVTTKAALAGTIQVAMSE